VRSLSRGCFCASRTRPRRLAASLIAAGAVLAPPFGLSSAADADSAPEHEIRLAIEDWRSAFNDRNEERVCDLFAPDVVANYQGEPARDYDWLCGMLRSALRNPDVAYSYSVRIDDVIVHGDTAVVRLVWALAVEKAGDPKQTIEEGAVDIFRRQSDGSWKVSRYLAYPGSR